MGVVGLKAGSGGVEDAGLMLSVLMGVHWTLFRVCRQKERKSVGGRWQEG